MSVTFRVSRRPREIYCGHARLCLSVRGRMPTLLHGPGCNLAEWYGMPPSCALLGGFAIGARVSLLWQHYGNAWQSPVVIRQAHRTLHALYRARLTPLAGDKIDAPPACAVPFRLYCGGVITRTQNVSEYMLVIAVCLISSEDLRRLRVCSQTRCNPLLLERQRKVV